MQKSSNRVIALSISSLAFAFYHVGIVANWFNPFIFVICIASLALAGLFMQNICNYFGSLKASWLVHGCANFAINTIGIILIFFMK